MLQKLHFKTEFSIPVRRLIFSSLTESRFLRIGTGMTLRPTLGHQQLCPTRRTGSLTPFNVSYLMRLTALAVSPYLIFLVGSPLLVAPSTGTDCKLAWPPTALNQSGAWEAPRPPPSWRRRLSRHRFADTCRSTCPLPLARKRLAPSLLTGASFC